VWVDISATHRLPYLHHNPSFPSKSYYICLPNNHQHFCIYLFRLVSTNLHFASSDSPYFNLWHFLIWINLHIRITVRMCVGVVNPLSVGLGASSTRWYVMHTISPIHSYQWTLIWRWSNPLSDPHIHSVIFISTKQVSLWHHHEFHRDGQLMFCTAPKQSVPLW